MSNVEVIEIGLNTLTISVHLSITWKDNRILLFRNTTNLEKFYLMCERATIRIFIIKSVAGPVLKIIRLWVELLSLSWSSTIGG